MYFSRIRLAPDASAQREFWQMSAVAYGVHRLVWEWFGDREDRTRDFLYRQEGSQLGTSFYTVSARPPVVDRRWVCDSKPYHPRLSVEDRLEFCLRANPVRARSAAPGARGVRHDIVMDAKFQARKAEAPPVSEAELVQKAGEEWLHARAAAHGMKPRVIRADGYQQHRFYKRNQAISLSTIEFNGEIEVTDPELLLQALTQGIGSAKGFGCGMLMVRRPR